MEFSVRTISSGTYRGLPDYEPSLLSIGANARVTLVAQVVLRDDVTDGGHWCEGQITKQKFRLQAALPADVANPVVTIVNGVTSFYRCPLVRIDESSEMLVHAPKSVSDLFRLAETCAGLGALGMGAEFAGWTTVVQNDINEKFCAHQSNLDKCAVVLGDICKPSTVVEMFKAAPNCGTIAFGFNCQPFSGLGDKGEESDARAATLPYGLYAAHLLQIVIKVLECVPNAATSPYVLKCLAHHMEMTKSDRSEVLLELGDLWPSKRRRWWTIVIPQHLGQVQLRPMPKLDIPPPISCVLPGFLTTSGEELKGLILTPEERKCFIQFGKELGNHIIDRNSQCKTALHSWGNQCVSCACGCRGPFSHDRLMKRGLFGALVHMSGCPPDANLRHLSAREVALLNAFPKKHGWNDDPRLLLAGVGQLASPMHAAWVFAHIRNHLIDAKMASGPMNRPTEIIACVASEVFHLRDQWFPGEPTVAMQLFHEKFDAWLSPGTSVQEQPTDPKLHEDDLTASQEEAITSLADELREHSGELPPEGPHSIKMPTSAGFSPLQYASDQSQMHFDSAHRLCHALEHSSSVGPSNGPDDQKQKTSQRTGREDPEEKKSGETQNQPAHRTQEPGRIKQPASGPQEPIVGTVGTGVFQNAVPGHVSSPIGVQVPVSGNFSLNKLEEPWKPLAL